MRSFIIVLTACLFTTSAWAGSRHGNRHGYVQSPRHHGYYHHNHYRIAPYAAGVAVLGLGLGIGFNAYNRCWREMVGYDSFGNPVIARVCN